ncbi:MAG: histidine phosphatase family protein [Kiritimatiellae bacterium]|jgi:broad specificity phosphatase PhoE|nr:histidine phosphatase family protein [Kiritimatiellia bacterium]
MYINKTTIDLKHTRQLLDQGKRVIIFLRHSERPEICTNDKDFGKHLGLTKNGIAMARKAGAILKGFEDVDFFASPMERCRLTASHFAKGMDLENTKVKDSAEIGVEGFYMQDSYKLQALMKQHGYMEFMQDYLNQGSAPHLNPIKSATQETINWMQSASKAQLSIFVSHDIFITAFATALGIRSYNGNDWIGFLHAAVLSYEPSINQWSAYTCVPVLDEHHTPATFSQ